MRLILALLALGVLSIAWGACTNPGLEPTPDLRSTITAQVQEQLATIPTATSQPTYTLSPTFTPYPTFTLVPTATPYPTHTPYPTLKPLATATPRPTARPTRAPTIAPTWQGTDLWYRDVDAETTVTGALNTMGLDYDVKMASLDADPNLEGADLYITLGCLGPLPVGYLVLYDRNISLSIDEYKVGIADDVKRDWVDHGVTTAANLTDDNQGVYISNRASLREIVRLLKLSASGLPEGQQVTALVYESGADGVDYWAEFNAAGVADALRYLSCHGV